MAHQAAKGDSGSDFPGLSEVPVTTLQTYVPVQGLNQHAAVLMLLQQANCLVT